MTTLKKEKNGFLKKLSLTLLIGLALLGGVRESLLANSGKISEPTETDQSTRTVKGVVTSTSGETLVGVSVTVKGTTNATMTDANGAYLITITGENQSLEFSYIGYKTVSRPANSAVIDITMEEDALQLDEVVAIGYGVIKKSDITGAIASVNAENIAKQPVANVAQALQSQVPGVTVMSNSGAPGGSVNVRIRGIGTVNNSDPLYVVDGMPVTNIDYLSTSDIQAMEVLKDASATAIYGSRGANGVILITTKQGAVGRTTITLDAYYGTSKILNNLDLMSGPEWYDTQTAINNVKLAGGIDPKAIPDLTKVNRNTSTNWMDAITRSAAIQSYNLSVTGGLVDEYKYNMGVNYINQEGTIKKTDYERISLRQNIEKTLIKKVLNIGTNFNLSQSNSNRILEGSNTVGIVNSAIKLEPVIPVYNEDGSYGYSPYVDYNNPVADIDYTNNKRKIFRVVGNLYADLKLFNDFALRSSIGGDFRRTDDYEFTPVYKVSTYQQNSVNKVTRGSDKFNYYVWETTLSYNKTLAEKHSINAVVGYTREWGRSETLNASKRNVPNDSPDLQFIDAALDSGSATANGIAYESGLISYLGRINYDYDQRYLATVSFRRDGSSKFAKGHKWGNYPSFALGWRISNEEFFKKMQLDWLSSLKFRGGWGKIGNQSIDDYMFQNLLSSSIQYAYLLGNGKDQILNQGLVGIALGNPDIKWETTETTNFGLDANLLNGRLTFSGEYYYKKTKNMLLREPIPNYWGYEQGPFTNVGSVENKGFEFNLAWQDRIGKVNYNIGFNISTIKNKVTSIGSGLPITGASLRNGNATITRVGDPVGAFYGYKTEGLIQTEEQLAEVKKRQPNAQLGDVIFTDVTEDGKLNGNDRVIIGSPIPDFTYAFNLGLEWNGIDFSMQWGGSSGNKIFNAMRYYTYDLASSTNKDRAVLNYWTPENRNTNIPRIAPTDTNDNMRISDRYVESGSYLRLRNLQIGYTLPSALSRKVYMQKLRIFFSGQNLLTITPYSGADPEVGQINSTNYLSRGVDIGTYPQAMTLTGGVSITF